MVTMHSSLDQFGFQSVIFSDLLNFVDHVLTESVALVNLDYDLNASETKRCSIRCLK